MVEEKISSNFKALLLIIVIALVFSGIVFVFTYNVDLKFDFNLNFNSEKIDSNKTIGSEVFNDSKCVDTDGGFDIYVKGKVITYRDGKIEYKKEDVCNKREGTDRNYVWNEVYSCTGERCVVTEAVCSYSGVLSYSGAECKNGCKDGACIK